jgi:hypothetical protein
VLQAVKDGAESVVGLAADQVLPKSTRASVLKRVGKVKEEVSLKLLHSSSAYCDLATADKLYKSLLDDLNSKGGSSSKVSGGDRASNARYASYFTEFSAYCYVRSQYAESYNFSMQAVMLLNNDLPPKIVIDTLRQASKACVVRRLFGKFP